MGSNPAPTYSGDLAFGSGLSPGTTRVWTRVKGVSGPGVPLSPRGSPPSTYKPPCYTIKIYNHEELLSRIKAQSETARSTV